MIRHSVGLCKVEVMMTFTVHHSLKNSLSGILSASESVLDELPEAREDQRTLMRAIQGSCLSMLQVLDSIMPAGERNESAFFDEDQSHFLRQEPAGDFAGGTLSSAGD